MARIADIQLLDFPKVLDERGNLSFIQNSDQIPFDIERIYLIYDVPGGAIRGGHAYRQNQEVIIAISGSFDLVFNDGQSKVKYSLNRSYYGLYVPNGLWRQLENFSTNSLCLIIASQPYEENDYVRDFNEFKSIVNNESHNF